MTDPDHDWCYSRYDWQTNCRAENHHPRAEEGGQWRPQQCQRSHAEEAISWQPGRSQPSHTEEEITWQPELNPTSSMEDKRFWQPGVNRLPLMEDRRFGQSQANRLSLMKKRSWNRIPNSAHYLQEEHSWQPAEDDFSHIERKGPWQPATDRASHMEDEIPRVFTNENSLLQKDKGVFPHMRNSPWQPEHVHKSYQAGESCQANSSRAWGTQNVNHSHQVDEDRTLQHEVVHSIQVDGERTWEQEVNHSHQVDEDRTWQHEVIHSHQVDAERTWQQEVNHSHQVDEDRTWQHEVNHSHQEDEDRTWQHEVNHSHQVDEDRTWEQEVNHSHQVDEDRKWRHEVIHSHQVDGERTWQQEVNHSPQVDEERTWRHEVNHSHQVDEERTWRHELDHVHQMEADRIWQSQINKPLHTAERHPGYILQPYNTEQGFQYDSTWDCDYDSDDCETLRRSHEPTTPMESENNFRHPTNEQNAVQWITSRNDPGTSNFEITTDRIFQTCDWPKRSSRMSAEEENSFNLQRVTVSGNTLTQLRCQCRKTSYLMALSFVLLLFLGLLLTFGSTMDHFLRHKVFSWVLAQYHMSVDRSDWLRETHLQNMDSPTEFFILIQKPNFNLDVRNVTRTKQHAAKSPDSKFSKPKKHLDSRAQLQTNSLDCNVSKLEKGGLYFVYIQTYGDLPDMPVSAVRRSKTIPNSHKHTMLYVRGHATVTLSGVIPLISQQQFFVATPNRTKTSCYLIQLTDGMGK